MDDSFIHEKFLHALGKSLLIASVIIISILLSIWCCVMCTEVFKNGNLQWQMLFESDTTSEMSATTGDGFNVRHEDTGSPPSYAETMRENRASQKFSLTNLEHV
jgi:hypothetical protein